MRADKKEELVVTGSLTLNHEEIQELTELLSRCASADVLIHNKLQNTLNLKKFCENMISTWDMVNK